jgi:hypothetical protein
MLCCSKGLLHRLQLLVAEHSLQETEIDVGPQHEDAVELLLRLDLVGVDRKVLLADRVCTENLIRIDCVNESLKRLRR